MRRGVMFMVALGIGGGVAAADDAAISKAQTTCAIASNAFRAHAEEASYDVEVLRTAEMREAYIRRVDYLYSQLAVITPSLKAVLLLQYGDGLDSAADQIETYNSLVRSAKPGEISEQAIRDIPKNSFRTASVAMTGTCLFALGKANDAGRLNAMLGWKDEYRLE